MVALLAMLVAVPALAQGQRRGLGGGMGLLQLPAPLQERLKLTAEQKTKMESIRAMLQQETMKTFQAIQNGGDAQESFGKLQELRQKSEADAVAALTPEQKQGWEGIQQEAREYAGFGPLSFSVVAVQALTDEQKTKLKALSGEMAGKQRELLQSLRDGDRQAALQKLQAHRMEMEASIKKLLTADQAKQFEAAIPPMPRRPGAN